MSRHEGDAMNKPKAATPIRPMPPAARAERSAAGAGSRQAPPKHEKPTGPVIYRLEKGADVWPGRK
jgi:hypothetical protein